MNYAGNNTRLKKRLALGALAFGIGVASAWAQDTTTTAIRHGDPTLESKVKNAEIVYVEGNDLVLKLDNGKVEHLIVPSEEKFSIDGKEVPVNELKAGAKLTQKITTTTTPRYVNTVRTLRGKVWHVNAPGSVIVTLPDGTNQLYKVPSHARFTVNGQMKTVFDLKKGMKFEATIVTDEPQTVVEFSKTTVVDAPKPVTPRLVGVLLFQKATPPVTEMASNVTAEHVDALPNTASQLPMFGLLGLLSIASSLGLGAVRKLARIRA
jgi:hypothetical protein